MNVIFDTQSLYYLPQYIPVYKKLLEKGVESKFVFYENNHKTLIQKIIFGNCHIVILPMNFLIFV